MKGGWLESRLRDRIIQNIFNEITLKKTTTNKNKTKTKKQKQKHKKRNKEIKK